MKNIAALFVNLVLFASATLSGSSEAYTPEYVTSVEPQTYSSKIEFAEDGEEAVRNENHFLERK